MAMPRLHALYPLLLAAAAPLAAQEAAEASLPDLAAMRADELVELIRASERRWMREPCTFGTPVFGALAGKVPDAVQVRQSYLLVQALCADEERRYADGARFVREMNAITPDAPDIYFALYFAMQAGDADSVLRTLRGLDDAGFAQLEREVFWGSVAVARRAGRTREFEELALGWADADKLTLLDPTLASAVAMDAMRAAARTGRSDAVDRLLPLINDPSRYIDLLAERTFEPFWPLIEQRAGPNLAAVGAEHVFQTQARLAEETTDGFRFSEAAHALHFNGQFADAIALAARWRTREGRAAAIEEGDGWALNIQAYAHDSLGETARADAVFDELAALDPATHPWTVNFVINRASRLVGQGRWREGLDAAALARRVAETYGTTYAKTIIARDHACALLKLGRADEAASDLAYLRTNQRDGLELAVQGLMCHGLRDEAAAMLLAGLRDPDLRPDALRAFTVGDFSLFYTGSILPSAPDLLADYPELRQELATHARAVPAAFVPQASLRRVRPSLPAW